ncbi:MAG TPA: hypothetical protein VIM65_00255 [Cyclobacteriaceae bacterium]
METTFFQKDYITIKYHNEHHILILEWLNVTTSSEFREGMNVVLEAMQYFKTGKLVCCLTKASALHPDDQQWVAVDWHNRALTIGHSHVAIVLAQDIFSTMAVEDTMSNVVLPTSYFDNLNNAIDWIIQF